MIARLPLRARLTALYALVFVLASGALLALTLIMVSGSIDRASAASSPAQQQYRANLEAELEKLHNADAKGTQSQEQADLKQKLVAANANSADAVRTGAVNTLLGTSLLALSVLVPAAGLGGWLLAGRALRPVGKITEAARRASETRLHERLALAGPRDEVTELADTFDGMLDRLEHAFDAQRRFVANASHELRTPLTVARTAIEVTMAKPERTPEQLESMAEDVRGAVGRAEHLVDSLLTLTRSQHLAHAAEPADLATAAQDALDIRAAEITGRELTVAAELNAAPVIGDRALLDRLASNLIDNAVRHNRPGGWVSVHTGHDGRRAVIIVANSGSQVDPARVAELFEPFQRADGRARSDGSGLGLGLSIVRAIAEAHRADLDAVARPAGGLTVTVRLPAAVPSPRPVTASSR